MHKTVIEVDRGEWIDALVSERAFIKIEDEGTEKEDYGRKRCIPLKITKPNGDYFDFEFFDKVRYKSWEDDGMVYILYDGFFHKDTVVFEGLEVKTFNDA